MYRLKAGGMEVRTASIVISFRGFPCEVEEDKRRKVQGDVGIGFFFFLMNCRFKCSCKK